jgi:hypothetical protein
VLHVDPTLELAIHAGLRQQLTIGYARALDLFRIG